MFPNHGDACMQWLPHQYTCLSQFPNYLYYKIFEILQNAFKAIIHFNTTIIHMIVEFPMITYYKSTELYRACENEVHYWHFKTFPYILETPKYKCYIVYLTNWVKKYNFNWPASITRANVIKKSVCWLSPLSYSALFQQRPAC